MFYIYTSAFVADLNLRELGDLFKTRDAEFLGSYRAVGHITWGPFGIGGGQKKGHPTREEIDGAVKFYEGLIAE